MTYQQIFVYLVSKGTERKVTEETELTNQQNLRNLRIVKGSSQRNYDLTKTRNIKPKDVVITEPST